MVHIKDPLPLIEKSSGGSGFPFFRYLIGPSGCSPPNSMLSGRRSRRTQLLNAIGDMYDRACCNKVLLYVTDKLL